MRPKRIKELLININESFPIFIICIAYLIIVVIALEINIYLSLGVFLLIIIMFWRYKIRIVALVFLIFLAFFQEQSKFSQEKQLEPYFKKEVMLIGVINNYPIRENGLSTYTLKVSQINSQKLSSEILIDISEFTYNKNINYLDKIECIGVISPNTIWQNDFLRAKSLLGTAMCDNVERVDEYNGFSIFNNLVKFRSDLVQKIEKQLNHPNADLLFGMIFGGDADYSSHLKTDMQNSGTSHIMAVSGYNVNLVMSFLLIFSSNIKRKYLIIISSILLILYLFFVGWDNIPAKRAVIMQIYIIGGWLLGHKANALYALCLATIILCIDNIFVYKSLSFQLSFAATIGIVIFREPVINFFEKITKNKIIAEALGITFVANIITLPIIWMYFNQISIISIPINLLIAPLVPVVFILGVIFIILLSFQINIDLLNYAMFWLLDLIIKIIDWSGSLTVATVTIKTNPVVVIVILLLLLFGISWTIYRKYNYE